MTLRENAEGAKPKPPFRDFHPALGWPLVRFSSRNADEGFMETSTTREYRDPDGWFTLVVQEIDEAWGEGRFVDHVAKYSGRGGRQKP